MTSLDIDELAEALAARLGTSALPKLVDAEAAAGLLGVPASWLMAEARAGRAPHRKLGKYVRFDPSEVRAWADTHAHGRRTKASAA